MIQSVNWKNVKKIEYTSGSESHPERTQIDVNADGLRIPVFVVKPGIERYKRKMTILRTTVPFSYQEGKAPTLFFKVPKKKEEFLQMLLDHINDLFGKNAFWVTRSYKSVYPFPRNIQFNKTFFNNLERTSETKDLDDFFERNPVQEHVQLITELKGNFKPDSKLFSAHLVYISSSLTNAEYFLFNFKGRELVLVHPLMVGFETTIQVLQSWQAKNILQNLETLVIMKRDASRFNAVRFEDQLNLKTLPASIDPPPFKIHPRLVKDSWMRGVTVPTYIVNKDGIVAFLAVIDQCLLFSVKKFTEKEMLERQSAA